MNAPATRASLLALTGGLAFAVATAGAGGVTSESAFRLVAVVTNTPVANSPGDALREPTNLRVAPDGRILFIERSGALKVWNPMTHAVMIAAKLPVFHGFEDGLVGLALDDGFATNHWVYLHRSLPDTGTNGGHKTGLMRLSRFLLTGDRLDTVNETRILETPTLRDDSCHAAGDLATDGAGNLFVALGDNTSAFHCDGFNPVDERPGRMAFDAQRTSANTDSLLGKILRIRPLRRGGYEIPPGNLFPPGTPRARPEIFIMGVRNPYRISFDAKSACLYWGDPGPDALLPGADRGPAGYDEINQARTPGFFGWPYFGGPNLGYRAFDFAGHIPGAVYDSNRPVNHSPNNSGRFDLPQPRSPMIWYSHMPSTLFPAVNGVGGPTALAGPVYRFDPALASATKFPKAYDHRLFIFDWTRNWIATVGLDANERLARNADGAADVVRFAPRLRLKRPIDLKFGPEGCLYVLEYGSFWGENRDSRIVRIEFTGNNDSGASGLTPPPP